MIFWGDMEVGWLCGCVKEFWGLTREGREGWLDFSSS
jgi:hypothetical protein